MLCSDFYNVRSAARQLGAPSYQLTGGSCIIPNLQARRSAKYVGCLARQLGGGVTNTESNAVAFTDLVGLVL